MLKVKNLSVETEGKKIINGVDLSINACEVHAIMGPNGAGKTTLAMALMGAPNFQFPISNFQFQINGKDMAKKLPEERARAGLFVSFQQPVEIAGISILSFLRTAYKALYPNDKMPLSVFKTKVKEALSNVDLDENFMQRSINEGFSGGEKKRAEVVQLLVLKPKFAILDEIDSGLDVDSLRVVAKAIKKAVKDYKMGVLLITHYQRILHYLKPNYVHLLIDGQIKKTDGMALVRKIERQGYAAV